MRKILKGNLDCIGCPNYHVTKNGKVYSNYKGKGWVKLPLNRIKNNGYVIVSIRDTNGYRYTYNIHQLVALVYVPNPNNHKYVCHKDNIRTHNHYKNLYWGTAKENTQQCIRDGRFKFSDTKLSRPDILQLLYEYDTGMIKAKLARKYGISPMLVYKYIKKRKRYEKDFERTHSMAS